MPVISDLEQKLILTHVDFLYSKGYKLISQDAHGFIFTNWKIQFAVFYERRQEASDITIKFIEENESFSVGWLSRIIDKNKNVDVQQKLENILYLLDFVEKNYQKIIDIFFCRKAMQEAEIQFRRYSE